MHFRRGAKAPNMARRTTSDRDAHGKPPDRPRYRRDVHGLRPVSRRQRRISLYKCLTTPQDPSVAALEGLGELTAEAGITLADVGEIVHGTTLVTNAIIERRGARLGLLTTQGFRDALEMGTEQRYDIYDLFLSFPEPLVPRRHRLEIGERLDRDGRVVTPLDRGRGARRACARLVDDGIEAVAVCFLHSYANPAHEQAVRALISARISQPVRVALLRRGRRAARVSARGDDLRQRLRAAADGSLSGEPRTRACRRAAFAGALRLMHSAGGLVSPAAARKFPIRCSNPARPAAGLRPRCSASSPGEDSVISFDMGGTTAKACLVEDGRIEVASMMEAARVHRFKRGSGLPIKAPVIDMIEIGAGGGSIAGIDEVGLLRVGPRSAGADPGPACYGRGGTEATVTDANLVLGFYDPAFFLGGRMTLDRKAALTAVGKLGDELGLSAVEAAYGIHKVVTESMAAAARIHLVEKGKDPRAYAMVGFGGAGPAHAAGVARILGIREVIIPPASGAASCLGFLVAPLSFERVRSYPVRIGARLRRGRDQRDLAASSRPKGARCSPRPASRARRSRSSASADMRLVGQMHEINVPLPAGTIDEASLGAIRTAFADVYTKRYTSLYGEAAIEAISFRVRVLGPAPELSLEPGAAARAPQKRKGARQVWFGDGFVEAAGLRPLRARARRPHRGPGDRRGARGDHRRAARRQPAGRRQSQSAAHDRRRGAAAGAGRAGHAARRRRWRASRPIRSRSRSCGAGSSPWWTRCGSP